MENPMSLDAKWLLDEALADNAIRLGRTPAIIGDDVTLSHQELHARVNQVASALQQLDVGRGIVAGLRFQDPIRHLVTALALLKMGVTQVAINMRDCAAGQKAAILTCGVDVLIEDTTPGISGMPGIRIDGDYGMVSREFSPEWCLSRHGKASSNSPALIFTGSGTTGTPKIMAVDFSLLTHLIERDLSVRDFQPGEKHYCLSALDYFTAKRRTLGCLAKGVTVMLPASPPSRLVAFCNNSDVQHLSLTTTQARQMLQQENAIKGSACPRLPGLKSLLVGSAPISESIRKNIRNSIARHLFVVYGTYEFGEATIASPEDQDRHPGTVGRPCHGVTVEVVDDNGNASPEGVKGHIRLKSARVMGAYLDNPEASARAFTTQGFCPGDMGSLTPDGNLVFAGRRDDMMIVLGMNVYPREIEQVLESHPLVTEAAVFPLFIEGSESIPFAVVCVRRNVSEAELLQFCAAELGWRKPRRIFFTRELPHNATGKVLKRELAKQVVDVLRAERAR
jgi:acyl-coenzyme A synthetase/AMP-(fatty) acid ligase